MTPREVDPQEGGRLLTWFWTGSHSGALVGLELTEACHVCLPSAGIKCMCQPRMATRKKM